MFHFPNTPDEQSVSKFNESGSQALDHVAKTRQPLFIKRKGKTAGVLLSPGVYKKLADAADLAESMMAIRRSFDQMRHGKWKPAEKVFADLKSKYASPRKPRKA